MPSDLSSSISLPFLVAHVESGYCQVAEEERRSLGMPKSGCSSNQSKHRQILVLVSDPPFDGECP